MYLGLESEYFFYKIYVYSDPQKQLKSLGKTTIQVQKYRDIENISTYLTYLLKIQVHSQYEAYFGIINSLQKEKIHLILILYYYCDCKI